MKTTTKTGILVFLCSVLCFSTVFAHGGRTDAYEGHRDNYNASGLGSYHYHCGSAPAHLHDNGICPYAYTETYTPDPEPTYTPPIQTEKSVASDLNSAGRKDDRYIVEVEKEIKKTQSKEESEQTESSSSLFKNREFIACICFTVAYIISLLYKIFISQELYYFSFALSVLSLIGMFYFFFLKDFFLYIMGISAIINLFMDQ